MIVFGLILMARKALTEVGGGVYEGDKETESTSPEDAKVEVEAKTMEIEAVHEDEIERE